MTGYHACHNVFDSALSMDEIVAIISLLNTVWPSEDTTLPELVEAFPKFGDGIDCPARKVLGLRSATSCGIVVS